MKAASNASLETWRNLTCVGADPIAITDCLNFGNPERPEIMGQFVGAIEGMNEACHALDYPVVSGNVSLYTTKQMVKPFRPHRLSAVLASSLIFINLRH